MPDQPDLGPESSAVQKHLEITQGVITRMAENSRSCKLWCVTLVSAVLVPRSTDGEPGVRPHRSDSGNPLPHPRHLLPGVGAWLTRFVRHVRAEAEQGQPHVHGPVQGSAVRLGSRTLHSKPGVIRNLAVLPHASCHDTIGMVDGQPVRKQPT